MSRLFYTILCLLIFALPGCEKRTDTYVKGGLDGRWAMTRVQDKSTNTDLLPPPGPSNQVYLDFRGDKFSGKTLMNAINEGTYTMPDANSINFGSFSSTAVVENEWGGAFLTMLHSCMLQSLHPCKPSMITWSSERKIIINTPMRYVITLEKI